MKQSQITTISTRDVCFFIHFLRLYLYATITKYVNTQQKGGDEKTISIGYYGRIKLQQIAHNINKKTNKRNTIKFEFFLFSFGGFSYCLNMDESYLQFNIVHLPKWSNTFQYFQCTIINIIYINCNSNTQWTIFKCIDFTIFQTWCQILISTHFAMERTFCIFLGVKQFFSHT